MRLQRLSVVALFFITSVQCWAWASEIPKELRGILLYAPDPEYPTQVWHNGITGHGVFRAIIDSKTGRVTEVKVVKSTPHRILNELSSKALLQWRFRPGISGSIDVPFNYGVTGTSRIVH